MARVTTHTNNGRGKHEYRCTGCGEPITVGQRYYKWVRRVGPKAGYRRHVECGPPRPTELSGRKTAQVEEAIQDYSAPEADTSVLEQLDHDNPPETVDVDAGAVFEDAVSGVIDAAESVADEYEEGVSNMPEQLQYAPTGEAMTAVAEALREWAEEIRDKASDTLTVDLPARGPDEDAEQWLELAEQAIQDAWDEYGSEIDDLMGNMPEYEG